MQHLLLKTPEPIPENSTDNTWKNFKNCLGALDGTAIKVTVPTHLKGRYRGCIMLIGLLIDYFMNGHFGGLYCCSWWRSDGSFKNGYTLVLEARLAEKLPDSKISATPHIESRLRYFKTKYSALEQMLNKSKQIDDTQIVHINAWEEETKVEVLQCEPGEATFLSRGEKCSPCDHSLLAKVQGCKQKPVSIRLQSTYTVLARLQSDSLTYYIANVTPFSI
uniref:Uncharacterized protein n=1 Tax=Zea mays TaxID=4577 RepID=A0A804U6Q6_MAIZE